MNNPKKEKRQSQNTKGKDSLKNALERRVHIRKILQTRMEESDRIAKEITDIIETMSDRAKAGKIISERLGPLLDDSIKKTDELTVKWLKTIKEADIECKKAVKKAQKSWEEYKNQNKKF